jgi:hypothetical protein
MSISAPPGQPSITQTLSSSFRDAWSLTQKNLVPAGILIALGLVASCVLLFTGVLHAIASAPGGVVAVPPGTLALLIALDVLLVVVSMYALAAAVRTINPEFRLTVARFFGMLGYMLVVMLLTIAAGIALVIPAYWVGVKLLLTPYTYAVTDGAPGALKTTWNMTTGYYWQTVGMLLLAGLCIGVLMDAAIFLAVFAVNAMPASIIVFGPLALAVLVWLMHVAALLYVRWVHGLLPRANMPHGGTVPVPA